MTQPPFDTGPGPTGAPGTPAGGAQWGPAQPPGFAPVAGAEGGTPWGDHPLAAGQQVGRKRFVLVMAFFALVLVGSVAGFVLTTGREVSNSFTGRVTLTRGPDGYVPVEPSPTTPGAPRGPVPAPVTYRGTGTKVLAIRRPEPGDALVYVKGRPGDGLFSVFGIDAKGQRNGFVITSTEAYEGVRVLDVTRLAPTASLEIEAAGSWVVQIRSARAARGFSGSFAGAGDQVLRYTGGAGVAAIRGGQPMKPFVVFTRDDRGFPRPLVATVGAFDGEKPMPRGPVLVEVQATGRWSIRVR